MRYPANFLIWGFLPILWFTPFIFMANAIGGPGTSTHFTEVSGFSDFIQFAVIGWFVYIFLDNSIWSTGNNFRWEQFSGTLEPLFITPVPRISILVGAAISDTVQCIIQSLILLGIASMLFGVTYTIIAIVPTVIILTMMIVALYGFSFVLAGLILVLKDPSILTDMVSSGTFALSPVNYPIQALPRSIQPIAYAIPTTIGIITVREIAITGIFEIWTFLQTLGLLGLLAVGFWVLGILTFRYAEKWTKNRGHMGGF